MQPGVKVERSASLGFCDGARAAHMALLQALNGGSCIAVLGEFVHNSEYVSYIAARGARMIDSVDCCPQDTVLVIPMHGVPREILEEARRRRLRVIDLTCDGVRSARYAAERMALDGRSVVAVGSATHAEMVALMSYVPTAAVVASVLELPDFGALDRLGVVSQTTADYEKVADVVGELKARGHDVEWVDAVCPTTRTMQSDAAELARRVDAMVVVGDSNSANNLLLCSICERLTPTVRVDNELDLDEKWFKGVRVVGLTAGASTPDFVVDAVERTLRTFGA